MTSILNQAEQLRKQAIDLLLAGRNQIDEKLQSLGYGGSAPKVKNCKVCGATDHDGRFHRIKKVPIETAG